MSTANKLTYLNGTKQELKQKINNLGGDITDNTTFRQYADKLQTIYDNAPKTDFEEGSNITLSNCLKGKLDYEDDIVGYGDTSQKSYEGYNIFNLTDYTNLVTIPNVSEATITKTKDSIKIVTTNTSGLAGFYSTQTNANGWAAYVDNFNASNTYYLSYDIVATTNCQVKNGFEVAQHTDNLVANQKIRVTTSTSSGGSFICYSSSATTITITNIVISTNSSKTSYEPYVGGTASPNPSYPQEIEVVTGEQEVTVRGTNLINGWQQGFWGTQDGIYNGTRTDYICTQKILVKPNTTYTYSHNEIGIGSLFVMEYANNDAFLTYTLQVNVNQIQFTTSKNTYYIGIDFSKGRGQAINVAEMTDGMVI